MTAHRLSRVLVAAVAACGVAAACRAAEVPPAAVRQRIVDPAVTLAGGSCKQCSTGKCRHHGGTRHHAGCRNGVCEPSCPVRPGQFGFYGTQWRKWPGTGVVQVSNNEAATPARPPRSAVPDVDEESLEPQQPSGVLPPPAEPSTAPSDREPDLLEPAADAPRTEDVVDPAAPAPQEPAAEPMEETPADESAVPAVPETKPKSSADDNLFDEARRDAPQRSAAAVPRTLARTAPARPATNSPATRTRATAWQPTAPAAGVARVPFSPAEEEAALRSRMQQLRQR